MATSKRNLLFKIITALFFGAIIIFLVTKIYDLLSQANSESAFQFNKQINDRNVANSKANSFGFNDRERTPEKPKGIYRIAVIGDSFIWGDGMPYQKIWSHKLEQRLLAKYDSIEVISWGKCGWSTLDEFNFFKQHGKDFNIDLLIIGWVDNDPDIGRIPPLKALDASVAYPKIYKVWPTLARFCLNNNTNGAYGNWMSQLYSPQNLNDYQIVLNEFHQYLTQRNIPSLVVLTPSGLDTDIIKHYNLAEPMMTNAGFPFLNTFPIARQKLKQYSPTQLQANLVNGHPGQLLTEQFAIQTQQYLEDNNYLKAVPKKHL